MTTDHLHALLDRYCNLDRLGDDGRRYRTHTRLVRIETGIIRRIPGALRDLGLTGSAPVLLVCDANTRAVAAEDLLARFNEANVAATLVELQPREGHVDLLCDDDLVSRLAQATQQRGAGHLLAVGSGTLNDAAKAAAHELGIQCSVLATAPSMNGFTSGIAAVLSKGVKTTRTSAAPAAVFADPVILAESPYRMIASGLGDLYSKPVSNADWNLSAALLGTLHSDIVMEIVNAGAALLDGVAPRLPSRDPDAVARLTAALMLSGLGMQAAGSSGPASGGEHLISHYIDMTAHAFGETHDFHGCQVAVGTVVTSTLYHELLAIDPSRISIDPLVEAHLDWPAKQALIEARFGPLAPAVIEHARRSWCSRDDLRARIKSLVARWDHITEAVQRTLRAPDDLEQELRSAGCPTRFGEIGVHRDRARRAILHCPDIRARYTILHLAVELQRLEAFADEYVQA
ncbi:MAG: iron-containing alcohol dehydrogenase [Deltaproteobacteria bacterium]|nr:MAG: iron-containing alcohol dehydrogenase [Deltaproteobacteria bacterium]